MSGDDSRARVRRVKIDADRAGQRLDNFLVGELKGVPRSAVYRMIRTGQVRINGGRAKAATRLEAGDEVRVPPAHVRTSRDVRVPDRVLDLLRASVLHEDEDALVIDKPPGLAVHAGSGLAFGIIEALRQLRPAEDLELVHRLDRDTSGCLLLARHRRALGRLREALRDDAFDKRYLCLLDGRLAEDRVLVDAPLRKVARGGERMIVVDPDGKPSRTAFRRLDDRAGCTFAEAELFTGRTHQVRVHAAHLGAPLAGDDRYAPEGRLRHWKSLGLKRVFLHAHRLSFPGPGGDTVLVESPLPDELRELLERLD